MTDRYVICIPADNRKDAFMLHCDKDETMKLRTLQKLVGGSIEPVSTVIGNDWAKEPGARILMLVNEEGMIADLPINSKATGLTFEDYIAGDAVLLLAKGEAFMGFTSRAAERIIRDWGLAVE